MIDLSKYKRPALQFSGGKDSLTCLYLLREQLDNVRVYWVNTGDTCVETMDVIKKVMPWVPHFTEIRTDVKEWRRVNGNPTDLLPASCTPIGMMYGMGEQPLTGRFDCCYANLMHPLHQQMLDDGVDAVVRGTKVADTGKIPHEGHTPFYEIILPLRDWSHQDVFDYLDSVGAPKNPVYEHMKYVGAPECMGCTAWWEDGKAEYYTAKHPERLEPYRIALSTVRDSLRQHLALLESELKEAGGESR